MQVKFRNTFQRKFVRESVPVLVMFARVAQEEGWLLDISVHSDGIEIDEEGITVHFAKISDKRETPDQEGFMASAIFGNYKMSTNKKRG